MGQFVTNVLKELEIQLGDYSNEVNESFNLVASQLENLHENLGPLMGGLFAKLYRENFEKNLYVPNVSLPNKLVLALNNMHQKIAQKCELIESNVKTKNSSSSNTSSYFASDTEDSDNLDDVHVLSVDGDSEEEKEEDDYNKEISDTESQSDDKHDQLNYIVCGSFDDVAEDSNQLPIVSNQPNNTNIFENVSAPASPSKKVIVIDGPSTEQSSNLVRPTQESTKILPTVNESKKRKLETEVIPYLQALAEHSKDLETRKQRESLSNQDNYTKAISAIENICRDVSALNDRYIKNKITTEDYIKETKKILEANQSDLKKHRGPKELVINLLAFFGTIGIAHAFNRFCLFKCHTNSSKIVNDMEASLNRLNPNL